MIKMHTDKSGKLSSKRIWGTIIFTSAILMTVTGGLGWYNPDASIVSTMFYTGAGLLGISVMEKKK